MIYVPVNSETLDSNSCIESETLERNGDIFVLEVIVSVEDEVGKVEFKSWDVEKEQFVEIGTVFTPPYRVEFETSTISSNWIQVFTTVFDTLENKICKVMT